MYIVVIASCSKSLHITFYFVRTIYIPKAFVAGNVVLNYLSCHHDVLNRADML